MGKKKASKKSDNKKDDGGETKRIARKIIQAGAFAEDADGGEKFKAQMTTEDKKKYTVIGISAALFLVFVIIGGYMYFTPEGEKPHKTFVVYSWEKAVDEEFSVENKIELTFVSLILIGFLCLTGPTGVYFYLANRRIQNLEDRLGDFLRDLAESARSGQTLHQAIRTASGGDYGSLTPEIKTMAHQISWGIPATDALSAFSQRVNTPLVNRAAILIIEASNAGGDVSKVLDAAATDTREIQLLRKERKVEMGMYVMVIFIAFFVFLVVIGIVYQTFVPQMKKLAASYDTGGSGGGGGMAGGMDPSKVDFDEVKLIYMLAGGVNGVGCGLVAGLMGSGRLTDGFKFVFIFVIVNLIAFTLLLTG